MKAPVKRRCTLDYLDGNRVYSIRHELTVNVNADVFLGRSRSWCDIEQQIKKRERNVRRCISVLLVVIEVAVVGFFFFLFPVRYIDTMDTRENDSYLHSYFCTFKNVVRVKLEETMTSSSVSSSLWLFVFGSVLSPLFFSSITIDGRKLSFANSTIIPFHPESVNAFPATVNDPFRGFNRDRSGYREIMYRDGNRCPHPPLPSLFSALFAKKSTCLALRTGAFAYNAIIETVTYSPNATIILCFHLFPCVFRFSLFVTFPLQRMKCMRLWR